MRLGKKKEKDKDTEKEQIIEGVARLICSPKQSHPTPMRGRLLPRSFENIIKTILVIFSLHRWYRMDRS